MNYRLINITQDYPTLKSWWEGQSWPAIPVSMLPAYGIMVEESVAGFLYKTDSSLAWIEWIVANPNTEKEFRRDCVKKLVSELLALAHNLNFEAVFSSSNKNSLIAAYEESGALKTDNNVTHFIWRLK
jgi:hypothetical protein